MFDNTAIQLGFSGLVGFRQSANALFTQLNAGLLVSNSGLNINDLPGVDFELIEYCVTNDYSDVNDYLEKVYEGCINTMLNKFISHNKSKWDLKEVVENTVAYKGQIEYEKAVATGRAFGYEIKPMKSNNLRLQITSLGLFADIDCQVTIFLYRANKKTALTSLVVNITGDNEDWNAVTDMIHYYQSQTEGAGQSLYLLVYEHNADFVAGVHLPLGVRTYQDEYCEKHKHCKITPVVFESDALNWNVNTYDLPDLKRIGYTNMFYGLNFRFNIRCDITHLLLDQVNLFAEALQYTIGIKILWDGVATTNVNCNTLRKEKDWVKFANKYTTELMGFNDEKQGYVKGIYDKLGIDISDLDNICLPCKKMEPVTGRSSY